MSETERPRKFRDIPQSLSYPTGHPVSVTLEFIKSNGIMSPRDAIATALVEKYYLLALRAKGVTEEEMAIAEAMVWSLRSSGQLSAPGVKPEVSGGVEADDVVTTEFDNF